ncbi:MAG: phosphatidylglycerophosphatase A [Leptospiraceae bacterium]|nr:phosphatidylglycerophosphatase A [Leptospiraceae bacterium]
MAAKKSKPRRLKPAAPVYRSEPAVTPATTYVSPLRTTVQPATTWYEIVATGFYSGYLPKAPGTWGSIFAALVFILTARLMRSEGVLHIGNFVVSWWALALGVFFTLMGITASERLADEWREKDPSEVVVDEFAGMFLACAFITPDLVGVAAAFAFFRLFDVWKPGIIHRLQDLPGGRGIVLDDVVAGLCAAPLAWLTQWAVQRFT